MADHILHGRQRWFRWLAATVVGIVAAGTMWVAPASADITFGKLKNAMSGWCLQYQTVAHEPVTMTSQCNGFTTTAWILSPVTSTAENDYTISSYDYGWCLDQHYSTTGPTNLLRAWDCTGVPNQRWVVTSGAHGLIIVNGRSRWCLDQSYSGSSPSATVVAWPNCHLQLNQFWGLYWPNA